MYWHQGWASAPDLVHRCAATWHHHNPGWDIQMLDAANLTARTGVTVRREEQRLALPALSDVIRIRLLERYGGVWADATLWCMRPLDAWIDSVCRYRGFFAYARPGEPAPWRPISTWFLAAGEGSWIVTLLRREVEQHVLAHQEGRVRIPTRDAPSDGEYLWFHRLFEKLLTTHGEFQCLWDCTPKLSATGPHLLDETGFLSPVTPAAAAAIQERTEHMFKLSHKICIPDDISGTVLDALYRSTETGQLQGEFGSDDLFGEFAPGFGIEWLENVFIPQSIVFYADMLPAIYQCVLALGAAPVRICDIGAAHAAGSNFVLSMLNGCLGRSTEMTCFDLEPRFEKYAKAKYPQIVYNVGNFLDCDEIFDLTIMSHILEHVQGPLDFISSVLDRTKFLIGYVPFKEDHLIPGHINRFDKDSISDIPGLIWCRIMRSVGWRTELNSRCAVFVCASPTALTETDLNRLEWEIGWREMILRIDDEYLTAPILAPRHPRGPVIDSADVAAADSLRREREPDPDR